MNKKEEIFEGLPYTKQQYIMMAVVGLCIALDVVFVLELIRHTISLFFSIYVTLIITVLIAMVIVIVILKTKLFYNFIYWLLPKLGINPGGIV